MILKSIIRMRWLLAVLVITLLLVSFTVSSVIQLGTGYTTSIFEITAKNNRPHLILTASAGVTLYAEPPLNGSSEALAAIDKFYTMMRTYLDPFRNAAEESPLFNCTTYALRMGFGYHSALYIISVPLHGYSEGLIGARLAKPVPEPEIVTATVPYETGDEELPINIRLGLSRAQLRFYSPVNETAAYAAELRFNIAGVDILLLDSLDGRCLNLPDRMFPAEPGDGIVDAYMPKTLAEALGLEEGSTMPMGGGELRVWILELNETLGLRYGELVRYPRFIITLRSELPDLLALGDRVPDEVAGLYSLMLLTSSPPSLSMQVSNETLEEIKPLLQDTYGELKDKLVIAPSPLLTSISSPETLRDLVETLPENISRFININTTVTTLERALLSAVQFVQLFNYNTQYLLSTKKADIGREIFRLIEELNNTLAAVAEENNCTLRTVPLEFIIPASDVATEDVYEQVRFRLYRADIECGDPGRYISISFNSDKIDNLLRVKYGSSFEPLVVLGLVSLIPAVFLMGVVMTGEGLNLIIGTMRRWLATASARGATPKMLTRPFMKLMLALSVVAVIVGLVLSAVSTGYLLLNLPPQKALGLITENRIALGATIVAVPLVAWIGTRGRMKEIRSIRAIEAVRPTMAIRSAFSPRLGRGSLIVIALTVLAVLTAFIRPTDDTIERVQETAGAIGLTIIVIMLALGVFFAPFTPIVVLHEGSKIISASRKLEKLVNAIVSMASKHDSVTGLGEASGLRVKEMLLSYLRAGILGFGLSTGSLLSAAALARRIPPWITSELESGTMMFRDIAYTLASVDSTVLILKLLGAIAAIATVIIVVSSTGAIFSVMRRQVAVLRARGARRMDVIRYVYFSFLHSILMLVIGGLILAGVFFVTIDSVVSVSFIDMWEEGNVPHLVPTLDLTGGLVFAGLLGAILLSPLIVSYRIAREKDIGRLLREEV